MTVDTALIEKREELKRRLAAGEYKTLVDVFLSWIDRLIRKIIRRSDPLPIWLITASLVLVLTMICFVAIYVAGDMTTIHNASRLIGLGYRQAFLGLMLNIVFYIASAVVINQYINRIFALWREDILNATESVASLVEFEDWLKKTCNQRLHLFVTILGGLLGGWYIAAIAGTRIGIFVGYGLTFASIIPGMFGLSFFYLFVMVIILSARLRKYNIKLFAADPSSSELLSHLSGELSFFVYFVAVYAAILTLAGASTGFLPLIGIILILFLWLPIIGMFILNQTGLSSIIQRAKWKTIREIQAKVEKLQATENFEDKETMDAINRLMDYHDRVKATRSSAIDLGAILGFVNSLLLPLLAFLLGNLDVVLKLFVRRP